MYWGHGSSWHHCTWLWFTCLFCVSLVGDTEDLLVNKTRSITGAFTWSIRSESSEGFFRLTERIWGLSFPCILSDKAFSKEIRISSGMNHHMRLMLSHINMGSFQELQSDRYQTSNNCPTKHGHMHIPIHFSLKMDDSTAEWSGVWQMFAVNSQKGCSHDCRITPCPVTPDMMLLWASADLLLFIWMSHLCSSSHCLSKMFVCSLNNIPNKEVLQIKGSGYWQWHSYEKGGSFYTKAWLHRFLNFSVKQ